MGIVKEKMNDLSLEVENSWKKAFENIETISLRDIELIYNFSDRISLTDFSSSFDPLLEQRTIFFTNICDYFSIIKVFGYDSKVVEVNPDTKVLVIPTVIYEKKMCFYISVRY